MLKKILIGVAVVVAAFLVFVATRPDTYTVTRSKVVPGPSGVAFAQVADFHNWGAWSPWEKMDPAMKKTFEGTPGAAGSTYAWDGEKAGAGKMTLVEAKAGEQIKIRLDFTKPMESPNNEIVFGFKPSGNGTNVTWTMNGTNGFMGKMFGVFMDMDSMLGKDFEGGLNGLTTVADAEVKRIAAEEAAAAAAAAAAAEAAAKAAAEASATATAPKP
jgi:hypothetical protein